MSDSGCRCLLAKYRKQFGQFSGLGNGDSESKPRICFRSVWIDSPQFSTCQFLFVFLSCLRIFFLSKQASHLKESFFVLSVAVLFLETIFEAKLVANFNDFICFAFLCVFFDTLISYAFLVLVFLCGYFLSCLCEGPTNLCYLSSLPLPFQ